MFPGEAKNYVIMRILSAMSNETAEACKCLNSKYFLASNDQLYVPKHRAFLLDGYAQDTTHRFAIRLDVKPQNCCDYRDMGRQSWRLNYLRNILFMCSCIIVHKRHIHPSTYRSIINCSHHVSPAAWACTTPARRRGDSPSSFARYITGMPCYLLCMSLYTAHATSTCGRPRCRPAAAATVSN